MNKQFQIIGDDLWYDSYRVATFTPQDAPPTVMAGAMDALLSEEAFYAEDEG